MRSLPGVPSLPGLQPVGQPLGPRGGLLHQPNGDLADDSQELRLEMGFQPATLVEALFHQLVEVVGGSLQPNDALDPVGFFRSASIGGLRLTGPAPHLEFDHATHEPNGKDRE